MGTLNVDSINDAAGSITALDVTKEIGIWQFVSTAAITAAANLNITGIAAGYDYLIQLEAFCPTTDTNLLFLRVSTNGGSSYLAGVSDYQWAAVAGADDADSEITLSGTYSVGNDAGNLNTIVLTLINPSGTGENMTVDWSGLIETDAATPAFKEMDGGGAYIGATTAVDAVQFGWSTNYGTDTFKAQGDITVWRRRRS